MQQKLQLAKTTFGNFIVKRFNSLQENNFTFNRKSVKLFSLLFLAFFSISSYSQLATEAFESGIPSTWSIASNLTPTNNWVSTPAGGYLATGGATVNPASNNTVGSTAQYFMISPQFNAPANGELRFYTKQGSFANKGTTYQIRISTASTPNIVNFSSTIVSWTEAQLNTAATTYEEKIVSLSSIPVGTPIYVAFVAVTNQTGTSATSGDSWFVDGVRVIPGCTPVTGITPIVGANDVTVNWTHPFATEFGVEVVPSGASHGSAGNTVTSPTYTQGGLTSNTTYDVYIQVHCDATTLSSWAGPFSFTTSAVGFACNTPIIIPPDVSTTPYVLSTNLGTFHDTSTYVALTSQGLSCQPPTTPTTWNYLEGDHAYLSYTPTTTGLINISQSVNTGAAPCYNQYSSVFIFDSCTGVGSSSSCLGGLFTSPTITTDTLSNFYVQAGHTYIFVISSNLSRNAGICFTFMITGSSCSAPSDITATHLTQTSATFSWNNVANLVDSWQYIALPTSVGAPTTQTLTNTSSNLNNNITGLIPGTDYYLYVRSVCGGTPGPWVAFFFKTQCPAFPTPYYTGFTGASSTNPELCWYSIDLNDDHIAFTYGGDPASGGPQGQIAKLRTMDNDLHTNDMLITPTVHFDGVTQKRLRYKFQAYARFDGTNTVGESTFMVKLSTTGVGVNDFTTIISPQETTFTGFNWIERTVVIPANIVGDVNIAWYLPDGTTQTSVQFFVDDVYIEDLPACSTPQYPAVTASSITTTSAELTWTNGFNGSQWEIVAQPLGSGTPTGSGTLVSTNPYTFTGLNPATQYEFYIRTYCNSTYQSTWVGPVPFTTLCIAQLAPYYESFNDGDITSKKFCWTKANTNADVTEWQIEETQASIRATPTFATPFTSFDDILISVPIIANGTKRLRFDYRAAIAWNYPSSRGNIEVLMSSTPDFSTYTTLIPSHDFFNSGYLQDTVIFNATGTFYIGFRVPPTMNDPTNSGIIMIDNVRIDDAPLCPEPIHLNASNITTSSANLTWNAGYQETQWQIVLQNAGLGTPTSTGTTINTTPSFNATSLSTDTAYEYYVRAICNSNDNSEWVGPYTFRTICNALPTPFIETFDSVSPTETCWKTINGNNDGHFWNLNQPVNPIFGDQMAALFTGSNGNNNDYLITPTLMAHAGQRLRFYYKVYDGFFEEDLKIKLSVNGTDTAQFTNILYETSFSTATDAVGAIEGTNTITVASSTGIRIGDTFFIEGWPFPYGTTVTNIAGNIITMSANATITQAGVQNLTFTHQTINNTEYKEMVINLTDITSPTNINIAFQVPYFPPNPWDYRGQYLFIDNVIVEDIPSCPNVTNVTASNIIDTSAQLNWTPVGTETTWEVSVQPFGTAAPVGNTLPQYLTTTSTHPITVSGLTPGTQYQYYVRVVCSGTSQSQWVGPFEFTTRCDFANVCQYTISLSNGNSGQVYRSIDVMQNGVIIQSLTFPTVAPNQPLVIDYPIFLCSGTAFNLYWQGIGSGTQYSQAQVVIKDAQNNIVWTSPQGLGNINSNIYTGFASCGTITCPRPTNLTSNNQGVLSWTAGGSETQWEVFIQPYNNGTLPQSGHIISSTSYTPIATDFVNGSSGTYEYFVRAKCSSSSNSYWSGPYVFIRNDEPSKSVTLQVNTGTTCESSGVDASFIGATASTTPTTCPGVNGGDIWYDFVATSKVHSIELSDFAPGSYYASAYNGSPWPNIVMSLYEVQSNGSLVEKACSTNNSMVTMYSTELTVGTTYKIRLKLDSSTTSDRTFHICITTPTACDMDAFNYDFEKLPMQRVTGISTIIDDIVIPGWRTNTDTREMFFQEGSNSPGVIPYSGGQCIQLIQDGAAAWDPADPNIKGLYKDFDTSEIIQMDYSFASASRSLGTTVKLFAGPPAGPFVQIAQHTANSLVWTFIEGQYMVPTGQNTTRFIFRVENNAIGHVLDAANFKPNTDIITQNTIMPCSTSASILLEAQGIGQWIADAANPSATVIATPNVKSTTVSGFTAAGNYIYHWKTRYCDKTVTITYEGVTETPTVTNPTIYCQGATANQLTATVPSGYSLMWYTTPTLGTGSTTAPTPSTATVGNSQTYYVCAVDGSGCEGPRVPIAVQVNALPTATISGSTTICSGSNATITFNGTPNATVTYTVNNGSSQTITLDSTGVASLTFPNLTTGTTVTIISVTSQGANPCTQTLIGSAVITVNTLPTATISGTNTICSGSTSVVTFNGTPNAIVTYTVDSVSNQTITLDSTGTATITTPALTSTSTYTLVSVALAGSLPCTQTVTASAIVSVSSSLTASISAPTSVCTGNTATVTFTGTPNSIVTYTVDSGSNQTITLDSTGTATLTTPALTTASTYTLVSVTLTGTPSCTQTVTGSATITIAAPITASISGTTSVCPNATAVITFTGTPNATVTYNINGGGNQTIILDATGNASVTSAPITTTTTYNLVNVISGCTQTLTGNAIISLNALPTATISGTTTICSGTTATITFVGTPNATVTYNIDGGSNQNVVLDATGNASLTTPTLTATSTYNLVSATSAVTNCTQSQTGNAVVTVNQLPSATISGTTAICSGNTATITFSGTPNAIVTYTVDSGSNQTITLDASGSATVTTPTLTTASTYTLVSVSLSGTPSCSQTATGSALITIATPITASISGTTSVCPNSTTVITFTGTPNATITYNINGGGNQTILLDATGNASVTSAPITATTTYNLVNIISTCTQPLTGNAVISLNALPTATISGTTTICSGTSSTITFTGTPNATITYNIDGSSNQTIVLDATGNVSLTTPTLAATSTYNLVSATSAITNCTQSLTGNAVVNVNQLPTATISGTTTICSGNTATITFSGTPNAIVTYTIDGGSNQTVTLNGGFTNGTATITTPALTTSSTYTLVSVSLPGIPSCSQTATGSAIITIAAPITASISGTTTICSGSTTAITFTGTPNATVTYNINGGGNQTILLDATGNAVLTSAPITATTTYNLVNVISTCTQVVTGSAVVSVNALPTASISGSTSICSGTTAIITFNGTPNATVTYTINGGSNQTIVLDATGNASLTTPTLTATTTYTLISVASSANTCTQNLTGSSIITIVPPFSIDLNDYCQDSSLLLEATPVSNSFNPTTANYVWKDATNTTIGTNDSVLNIDTYLAQYPTVSLPMTFTVTITDNGCTGTKSYTITSDPCKLIPRGISPNNDTDNDTFDLTGMGVKELNIFNRYGTKVYSFQGEYTNQWAGLTDNGQELPDGTYFYSIHKEDGSAVTGWVYINRQQ